MKKKDYGREMLTFIEQSPSCFHVVKNLAEKFSGEGFCALEETEDWKLKAGGKYYVVRNDSSLIAFQLPEKIAVDQIRGFHMTAAHVDSPSFKIKECAEMGVENHYIRLNTEKYGGMILSSWLDRPLSVAGRIVVRAGGEQRKLQTKLVNVDRDLLVIPNLAIHMNRDINKGVEYNPQVDMLPLYACCSDLGAQGGKALQGEKSSQGEKELREKSGSPTLLEVVAESAGVRAEDILGHDLFLYVRDKGRVLGAENELVLSPKLDDLQCVYAQTQGFLETSPKEYISLCAAFDNEEVGSRSLQGADSTFLEDVLARIGEVLGAGAEDYQKWIAGSFLISADNAHAVHPNHPEKADPTNRPYLNGGIVIKYQAGLKYITDGLSAAKMKNWCEQAGVPYQTYTNRSDVAGGSTLGNVSLTHVSVPSADIGLPQLAMHSAVETAGMRDTEYAVKMFRVFFGE